MSNDNKNAAALPLDVELAQDRLTELRKLERDVLDSLPAVYYMDPPDGGNVSLGEQVKRMAEDAALWRKHSSTPAAPGIDLGQFRPFVEVSRRSLAQRIDRCDAIGTPESLTMLQSQLSNCDRLLALIDASPKGGNDEWQSMETAPKSVADGSRIDGIYLLGFIPDDDLVDPQAGIDVIWWEPLLPNSKGGRGKWCASAYGETVEVMPTGWRHLPAAPATSAEVGA